MHSEAELRDAAGSLDWFYRKKGHKLYEAITELVALRRKERELLVLIGWREDVAGSEAVEKFFNTDQEGVRGKYFDAIEEGRRIIEEGLP